MWSVVEPAEVSEVRFFSKEELDGFIKGGGNVNLKHIEVFNDIWR